MTAGRLLHPKLNKPVLSFCASGSGIGKTTLLSKLIPVLTARGLRVSVVKHAHHSFDIDYPGKDSYILREAGTVQMLIGSRKRWALVTELSRIADHDTEADISLQDLLTQLDHRLVDLILVEGFRHEAIPKIEIYRPSINELLLADNDDSIIAVATDSKTDTVVPVLDLNNPQEIADFICNLINF